MIALTFPLSLCPVCFPLVSGALGAQGSEATFSGELSGVTSGPASGEGLQSLLSDDDELELDEENVSIFGMRNYFLLGLYFFSI